MAFKSTSYFDFSSEDETKPVKQDFVDKTIRATVTGSGSNIDVNWQIIKKAKFNAQRVIIFEGSSTWSVCANDITHEDGRIWEPDPLMLEFMAAALESIKRNEFMSDGACEFLLSLFDHTEVDILGEESIFRSEFPKLFQYRKNHVNKMRARVVKKTMKS